MLSLLLRRIALLFPDYLYVRAIPNRILKPLHRALALGGGVVDVLGFKMRLDPTECVDGILWFSPHRYEKEEISFLLNRFPKNGVFVDVGANIGFWSLRFSQAYPEASIISIEANPETFKVLSENININRFENINAIEVGVSDENKQIPFYLHDNNNRGADSFAEYASGRKKKLLISVRPLNEIFAEVGVRKIDIMKIDIEGFEERVFNLYFSQAPISLWPKFICAETTNVPRVTDLLKDVGYKVVLTTRSNSVFEFNFLG